jgi:hypothetical protein
LGSTCHRAWSATLRFAELLDGAGLDTFARLIHDPVSERGFLDAHLLARRHEKRARWKTGR